MSEEKVICTMCGNELDDCDLDSDFNFHRYIGFGSKYDLSIFEARLCCRCFDKILDTIVPMFKHNPISEYDIVSDNGQLIAKRRENNET